MPLLTQAQKDFIIDNVETLATTVRQKEDELRCMHLKYELLYKDFLSLKNNSVPITVVTTPNKGYDCLPADCDSAVINDCDSDDYVLEDFYID